MEEILKQLLENQNLILKTLQHHSAQFDVLQKGQTKLEARIENLEYKTDRIDTDLVKLETRIENEVVDKIRGLFDDRDVQNDVNQRIFSALGRIEAKIDVLQMETAHIRRVK